MEGTSIQMELPNPQTPLAFIPPDIAKWFEITRYVTVGTLGMYLWDVLTNMKGDIMLLTKYAIRFPTLAYFVARISAFAFIVNSAIFITAQVDDCEKMELAETISFSISVSSTALLFFLRVRAIFHQSRLATYLFAFMWVATAACSVTIPISVTAAHIGPTKFCTRTVVKQYGAVAIIVSSLYDTLIFLSISYRLLKFTSLKSTFLGRMKSFFTPTDLPSFSRALLQNGQEYYLVVVGINIIAMGIILAPNSLPDIAHTLFTVPNIALSTVMVCRVHRDLKFGRIQDASPNVPVSTIHFRVQPGSLPASSGDSCWETGQGNSADLTLHTAGRRSEHLDLERGYDTGKEANSKSAIVESQTQDSTQAHLSLQTFVDATVDDDQFPSTYIKSSQEFN